MLRRWFLMVGAVAGLFGGAASAFAQVDPPPSGNDGTPWTEPPIYFQFHHTDAARECAYDRQSHFSKLDKALDEALQRKWTVVDMKADWKAIYPFERK